MDGRSIPGFYYDPEKKKYFRIQQAHNAPQPGSKYTRDNVRKLRERRKIEKAAAVRSKKRKNETVVRAAAHSPLTQASIDREIGLRRGRYYLRNIWPRACASCLPNRPENIVHKPEENITIRCFDRDPTTKTLYAVHGDYHIKRLHFHQTEHALSQNEDSSIKYAERKTLNGYSFGHWDTLYRMTSPISSLSYLPNSGSLVATTYGSDRAPTIFFTNPDRDGPYVGQLFTPKGVSTIWDATVRPHSFPYECTARSEPMYTEDVVVAASNKLIHFKRKDNGDWRDATIVKLDTDILAVEWISKTLIVFGCRNGSVYLHDASTNHDICRVLKRPYPITQIRRADVWHRFICAGPGDTLFLCDLKYSHERAPSTFKRRARLVQTFQHSNKDDFHLGIDIHKRLGLVAVAQGDSASGVAIRVHNIWTGKVVKEFHHDVGWGAGGRTSVLDLKFMDKDQGEIDLWATWDGGIARFGM